MKNVGRSSAFRPRYPNIYYRTNNKDKKQAVLPREHGLFDKNVFQPLTIAGGK